MADEHKEVAFWGTGMWTLRACTWALICPLLSTSLLITFSVSYLRCTSFYWTLRMIENFMRTKLKSWIDRLSETTTWVVVVAAEPILCYCRRHIFYVFWLFSTILVLCHFYWWYHQLSSEKSNKLAHLQMLGEWLACEFTVLPHNW